jgi:hypothetical protein
LANQHLIVEKEIMSISGKILGSAVLLEVLPATRINPAWRRGVLLNAQS